MVTRGDSILRNRPNFAHSCLIENLCTENKVRMGHSLSQFKKSKSKARKGAAAAPPPTSNHEGHNQNVTKFPLPLESQMLRQIKAQYKGADEGLNSTIDILLPNDLENDNNANIIGGGGEYDILQEAVLKRISTPTTLLSECLIEPSKEAAEYFRLETLQENGAENAEEWKGFLIIDMPILVVEKLLDYLSPSAILALRLTCTSTKGWIDRSGYILRDFELRIEAEPKDAYICPPSTTPWSNFAIPYLQLHSTFIQETVYNYCDLIWRLEVYPPKPNGSNSTSAYSPVNNHSLFDIVNQCPELEHLGICRLDTMTNLGNVRQYEKLRVLSIDRLQWMSNSDFRMFESLVMKCPHLEYIKMPEYEILGSLAFNFYDVNVSPEREYLVRPLIRYLDSYRNSNSTTGFISRGKKLYIDVLEFEDFKLCSSEIFYELSRKCVECNAVLMNVYFVPRDAVNRNQQDIVEGFASMFGFIKIDFHAELWKNLEVMECWIEDHPDDVELIIRQLSFLRTISRIPTLRSLTIRLSIDDPDICSQTLAACVGENYPGIVKLILRRHQASSETYVRIPLGFGSAFSNVKYIYFQELDSRNEDFKGLWGSLPNLEELFMYKCPYLTQDAFILSGDDGDGGKSAVLQLTKLQVLVIFISDGAAGFNDEFLIQALRFMRLRGFALRGAAGVEFTEKGMISLLNSPFHDTIEDFEAPSMFFRPSLSTQYWNFYIALPKKELRRNRIWLSCSVLLNSLSSRQHPYDFKRKCLGI